MRRMIVVLSTLLLLTACSTPAPATPAGPSELTGDWKGAIQTPGDPVEFGVHFTADGGTLDIPAQGLPAMKIAELRTESTSVSFTLSDVPGSAFRGTRAPDGATITGDYTQANQTIPFSLARGTLTAPARPPELRPPFPYRAEDVTYSSSVPLADTLTLPAGPGPHGAVLMITGSGAQNRDETTAGHKPFLLLADTMTRAGLAVLRVDDRGIGGSGGTLAEANYDDLAADALAGIAFLKGRPDIDPAEIGLFGHSEGGYLAPLVAQRAAGGVAFVAMMAGPAVAGDVVLQLQNR